MMEATTIASASIPDLATKNPPRLATRRIVDNAPHRQQAPSSEFQTANASFPSICFPEPALVSAVENSHYTPELVGGLRQWKIQL